MNEIIFFPYSSSKMKKNPISTIPRAWFSKFTIVKKSLRYHQSNGDDKLFIKHFASKGTIILLEYVDDIFFFTGDDQEKAKLLGHQLSLRIEIKSLGRL